MNNVPKTLFLISASEGARNLKARFENLARNNEEESRKRADEERQRRTSREKMEREASKKLEEVSFLLNLFIITFSRNM